LVVKLINERGVKMKKILLYAITMVFALTLGVSYANAGGKELQNGITDFSGRTYDTLSDISMATPGASHGAAVESSNAGGLRSAEPGMELNNGVTDFSGRTYDTLSDVGMAAPSASRSAAVESSNAGGPRTVIPGQESSNGITDFSGRTYDSL
jgi:hypothetical protein